MGYCPNCNLRYSRQPYSGDFVHDCSKSPSAELAEEDVLIVGTFSDFDGSGTKGPSEVMNQGVENRLAGTLAGVLGKDEEDLTIRGKSKTRYRQRTRFQYIEHKD